jgi:DNA (cytosine-5)-methyltransferase 1
MDTRPVAIDFFSCQGGSSMGLSRAGFRVICVDKDPQPRNPFEFVQADAIADFHAIVAEYRPVLVAGGPPCQDYSFLKARTGKTYPRLIRPFRDRCLEWGGVYLIENVDTPAVKRELLHWLTLCGSMFDPAPTVDGLLLKRHRLFESNVPLNAPGRDACRLWPGKTINVHGGGGYRERKGPNGERIGHGNKASADEAAALLGVDWMTVEGMNECIPPRYTEHLGTQLMAHIRERAA